MAESKIIELKICDRARENQFFVAENGTEILSKKNPISIFVSLKFTCLNLYNFTRKVERD